MGSEMCIRDRLIKVAYGDPTPGQPAPETLLLIYLTGTDYKTQIYTNIKNALVAAGAIITEIAIPQNDSDTNQGIGPYLGGINLDDYCEVWDIRFDERHNAAKQKYSVGEWDDSITDNDIALYQSFLQHGGHLYLQGEHDEFSGRNKGLLQLIATVSGAISWPGLTGAAYTWNTFDNSGFMENFGTDYNTLTKMDTYYTGYVTQFGNGHPVTTRNGGTESLDLAFYSGDLKFGNGRLFVNFDTNEFSDDTNCSGGCFTMSEEGAYIQNVYDWLSNCYKYEITKSVNPGSVCVGETATYRICYNNIGTKTLPNVTLWDTLPAEVSYVGSSVAPTGNNGNLYWWHIGDVASGTNACIDVYVRADSVP